MKLGDSLVGRSERIPRGVPCSETKDGGSKRGREEGRKRWKRSKSSGAPWQFHVAYHISQYMECKSDELN